MYWNISSKRAPQLSVSCGVGVPESPSGRFAHGVATRFYGRDRPDDALLHARIESGADGMHFGNLVGAVALDAVHERAAVDIGGNAVEEDVAVYIGHE